MFFKKKKNKQNKLDKLVTWLIIWWAVAGMVWLSKTDKAKEVIKNIKNEDNLFVWIKKESKWFFSKWYELFWKTLAKTISIFSNKK